MLIVTTTKGEPGPPAVSLLGVRTDDAKRCVGHEAFTRLRRYVLQGGLDAVITRLIGQVELRVLIDECGGSRHGIRYMIKIINNKWDRAIAGRIVLAVSLPAMLVALARRSPRRIL